MRDSGLAAHLQGHDADAAALAALAALATSRQIGPLLENFVVQEVRRHLRWSATAATAWHFRTALGREVDMVLEAPGGRIVGLEVKAGAGLAQSDFNGLRELAAAAGKGFCRGAVLYSGEQLISFGDRLWAVPLGVLWAT